MCAAANTGLLTTCVVTSSARVTTRVVASMLALVTIAGCANVRIPLVGSRDPMSSSTEYSGADLRSDLALFADHFGSAIIAAGDRIVAESTDRGVRRTTILWKLRLVPVVQELAFQNDPQEAFASVLTLTIGMRDYLERGQGASLFGEQQSIAVDVSRQLEQEILEIGRKFIDPKELAAVVAGVDEAARRSMIHGADFSTQRLQHAVADLDRQGTLSAVLNAPLSPFRAFEGMSSGAAAIREFNRTAEEFAQIVAYLPRQLRWETQLLLYDVEDRDTVVQMLAAVESAAASAERVAAAAERLPDDMRTVLEDTEPAFVAANQVLATVGELLGPLQATAEQLRLGSASWEQILAGDDRPQPDARPFDVREWEQTFAELAAAATELRDLTGELQTTLDTEHLGNALRAITTTIDDAEARARAIVDLAAWRALQLLVVVFVLLVVLLVLLGVSRRTTRRVAH